MSLKRYDNDGRSCNPARVTDLYWKKRQKQICARKILLRLNLAKRKEQKKYDPDNWERLNGF